MQVQILPSRQSLIDRIELQYEYGQSLICLLGSSGLGKSYLLESFVTDKFLDFNKVYLQLTPRVTEQQVISQLLEQLFTNPLIDYHKSLSDNYIQLLEQQVCSNTVLVIDDIHFLSEELIDEIEHISEITENAFYVLSASTSKVTFKKSANIYFEALSYDESIALMSMYFVDLPNKHEPVFKAFVDAALGNPALLLAWEPTKNAVIKKKNKHILMILSLLFVVLITILLSFLFNKLSQDKDQDALKLRLRETSEKILTINEPVINKKNIVSLSNKEEKVVNSKGLIKSKNIAVPVEVKKEPERVSVDLIDESFSKVDHQQQKKYSELTKETPVATKQKNDQKLVIAEQIVKNKNDEAELNKSQIKNSAINVNNYDNAWFLKQEDPLVMLQLIGVSQESLLQKFIDDHELKAYKIYKSKRYGGSWWVITIGPFSSMIQSQEYKQSLALKLEKLQPFSKSIKNIKQEIALLK